MEVEDREGEVEVEEEGNMSPVGIVPDANGAVA